MFGGISKATIILALLPALVRGNSLPFDLPRHPVIVSQIFGLPYHILFDSFIKKDLPKGYQKLSAKEKQDILWDLCLQEPARTEWDETTNILGIWLRNMNTVFDHKSDERPWRGKKTIHTVGSICKAKFEATSGTPYTGLLKGCKTMMVRL